MNFTNPPAAAPKNVFHKTFYSHLAGHEVGYNIYLPPEYETGGREYPVVYHLHGWQGSESSEIHAMEKVYSSRQAITVFPNLSLPVEDLEHFPVEIMILQELIPYIENTYHTAADREGRALSGFSMGGGMAFYYAVKYPELFSAVTAYAGTYHHYFDQGFLTVGADAGKAAELRELIRQAQNHSEKNILDLLDRNADNVREKLRIELHVGTADVLYCDNEILRLHMESLGIPHVYKTFAGVEHTLGGIL